MFPVPTEVHLLPRGRQLQEILISLPEATIHIVLLQPLRVVLHQHLHEVLHHPVADLVVVPAVEVSEAVVVVHAVAASEEAVAVVAVAAVAVVADSI